MKTSDNGRKFIEQFEGLILSAYDDYNDKVVPIGGTYRGTLTIGYGHTDAAGSPPVHVGQTITSIEADGILSSDLHKIEEHISTIIIVPLNQNQFDALVSFEFNTGALAHSSGLRYLNEKDFEHAWYIFEQYVHASGRELPGLVRRRQAEKNLFFTAPKFNPIPPQTKWSLYEFILKLIGRSN